MAEWILVGITAAYLIATVFISVSNNKSAKATQKQVEEMIRQYNDSNRALVTVNFEVVRSGLLVLHIKNQGNRIAKNVTIKVDSNFVQSLADQNHKSRLNLLCDSTFFVGIGQSWYCSLGATPDIKKFKQKALHIDITYSDTLGTYSEPIDIMLDDYFWSLIYDSPLADIYGEIKKQSTSIESINNTLKRVIPTTTDAEEEASNYQEGLGKLFTILELQAKENNDV